MEGKAPIIQFQFSPIKYLTLVLLLLLAGSCGFFRSPARERCQKIIPREQLTNILTDIYLMEGYLSDLQTRKPEVRDSVDYYFAGIFLEHGVSKAEFQQALDCYLLFENEMELIHEEILNRLSLKMTQAEAEVQRFLRRHEAELLLADSLITDSMAAEIIELNPQINIWLPKQKPPMFFIRNHQGRRKVADTLSRSAESFAE